MVQQFRQYIYGDTHTMEYYSATKKWKILPFVTTWVDFEGLRAK